MYIGHVETINTNASMNEKFIESKVVALQLDGFDEINVAVAGSVPCLVDTIGEYDDELGSVTYGLHTDLVILEFVVLHPIGVLVVAVTEDEQRTTLAQVLWRINIIRTVGTIHCDVVCLHWQQSCNEQEK